MDFNIRTGSSNQEIAFMKKSIAKSADAVEQLESEIAVKRGHWHLYGEYTVEPTGTSNVTFDTPVSGVMVTLGARAASYIDVKTKVKFSTSGRVTTYPGYASMFVDGLECTYNAPGNTSEVAFNPGQAAALASNASGYTGISVESGVGPGGSDTITYTVYVLD